jgi:hypothetical protein
MGLITNWVLHATVGSAWNKVMAGGTPANPAALAKTSRETPLQPLMSLAHHLIKEGGRGGRCVETRDVSLDRQANAHIASLFDQPVDALAFAADDEANGLGHVELPRQRLASRIESDAPDVGSLDLGNRRRHAGNMRNAQQLARA